FVLSFTPLAVTLVILAIVGGWRQLPTIMNQAFVRGLGTLVLAGVLVMIASSASGCIAAERRKRTLDDLLLTELSTDEILAQKWWASIVVVRWALVWVAVHWVVADPHQRPPHHHDTRPPLLGQDFVQIGRAHV